MVISIFGLSNSGRQALDGSYDPKRSGSRGFHEGIFDYGFGGFSTVKKRGKRNSILVKRIPEMTSKGMNGDAFTGAGLFTTPKNGFSKNLL